MWCRWVTCRESRGTIRPECIGVYGAHCAYVADSKRKLSLMGGERFFQRILREISSSGHRNMEERLQGVQPFYDGYKHLRLHVCPSTLIIHPHGVDNF